MNEERSPVDYAKAKRSALEKLSAAGDARATRELERRGGSGMTPADDMRRMAYLELRAIVCAWQAGATPEERAASFERATLAQFELEARRRVADRNPPKPNEEAYWGPQAPLPAAPWLAPIPPRCAAWRRPAGSSLYPSEADQTRAGLAEIANRVYEVRK